jgi:hypothetical protein
MRAIVAHIMVRDAVAGIWFAIGRSASESTYTLIEPHDWNFLLMNIEQGAVGRDGLSFRDLRCALTKNVQEDHPICQAIRTAQEDLTEPAPAQTTERRLVTAPPLLPADFQEFIGTGAPGRRSSMHLVKAEFDRRCRDGQILQSLEAEAASLETWLKSNHPTAPRATARTIENRIRNEYRKAKHALSNSTKL